MAQIAVIVPVYKVEPYLRRCVDSILKQTFTDFELILVDDGSPDNCGAICDEYAQKDSRVHVIHQANGGLSAARNAGIEYCLSKSESQYISFIDSDDCVSFLYLEKLYKAAVDNQADISICGHTSFSAQELPDYSQTNFSGSLLLDKAQGCQMLYECKTNHAYFVVAYCKLYKAELFRSIRFPVGRIHEDQFTTYKLFYTANRIVEIGECLYGYFLNENGIMRSPFSIKRFDDLFALDEAISFFRRHGEDGIGLAAQRRKEVLWAQYSMQARKTGIYSKVPNRYKLPVYRVDRILTREWGHDRAEYFISQFSPTYVRIMAYLRKMKQIVRTLKK